MHRLGDRAQVELQQWVGLRQGGTKELGCQPVMENHERVLSRKVTQPDCILDHSGFGLEGEFGRDKTRSREVLES